MNRTIYFPAISVGTYLTTMLVNEKYNEKSFRFYNKDEDSFFYYPNLLVSAGHNFKKEKFREKINFPAFGGKGKFFADSGGFQLAKGALTEKQINSEIILKWAEENADIFPILDVPPYITGQGAKDDHTRFKDCLRKSVMSAKYFHDNRTRPDAKILNVLHGRDIKDIELWYSFINKIPLDGWAGGGTNSIISMLRTLFFLKSKGEFSRKTTVYYHIFGVSKCPYMVYIELVQHLFNKAGIDVVISYDSSYPLKTAAFGNYFMFPSFSGVTQVNFSNKFKEQYQTLSEEARMPCNCHICSTVTDVKSLLCHPKDFYNIISAHNMYLFFEYKKIVEKMVSLGLLEVWETAFDANVKRNMKVIEKAFYMKEGWYEYLIKEIREDEQVSSGTSMEELF